MKEGEFRQLIARAEGETLDYKADGYDLQKARNDFTKDLLAMANTPREQPAYIVWGVRWTPEAGSEVVGLGRQLDDSDLQNAIGSGRVQPYPRFTYTALKIDGKQVGVVEVPLGHDGPYTAVKDFDSLQAGAVYFRRGTKNDRAVGSEVARIVTWFQRREVGLPSDGGKDIWRPFLEAVQDFDPQAKYVLVLDRISSASSAPVYALGTVPWRAVLDFDPDSESSGALSLIAGSLGRHRVVHRVVRGEYRVQPEPGVHWFFARGLSGRQETLASSDHRAWLKSYKQEIGRQLGQVAGDISPCPVVAIVVWSNSSLRGHLRTIIEELHGAFGQAVDVVFVSEDASSFEAIAEESGATFIPMTLRSLCAGIAVHFADTKGEADERFVLATSSGSPVEIASTDWLWLSEDLELLHRSTGLIGEDDPSIFRRGGDVTWRNLHLRHDCERDITHAVRAQVEEDLRRRQTVRINLYHAPGGGGTTTGNRVAWDLHHGGPVALLKRCAARDTAEKIAKISALTESSVLVVIDGGKHSERDIEDLFEFLRANQTPAVLLQVLRRFKPQQTGRRLFWLNAQLSEAEADRFRDVYTRAAPNKKDALAKLAGSRSKPQRNAFFFGLTAFDRDFRGLRPYIEARIADLSSVQRRILAYAAIAHYYGQQSIPTQAFASLLSLPRSRSLSLSDAFAGAAAHALELLAEGQTPEWRTVHPLVALEVLQQVLAPKDSQEPEFVWRQSLSSWGKDFASFCRGDEQVTSDHLLELVRRVFIYRDNIEVLGTERSGSKGFSQLIDDIPSTQGKIEVLRHLTDCFPLEAHLHAHLGRFLGLHGEYNDGLKAVEFAISVQPEDHVLHHMRGMVLRRRMRAEAESTQTIDQLVDTAREASASFAQARRLGPDLEHGYISEVQMLVELLDQAGQGARGGAREMVTRPGSNPFLKEALDRAEDLLDQVQNLYQGENPSRYVLECRAKLQRIYGDYQTALQGWDSLLSRAEVAKPPVRRQIVWTILRRHEGSWNLMTRREVDRVRKLLEENLEEESGDSTSLRLWLRAIRHTQTPPSMDSVTERVSYWKANTGSLDAAFYMYVLHTLRALKGSSQASADAERALEECRVLTRYRRDRTRSFEWIGAGDGVAALVHQSQLGEWKGEFWESTTALHRVNGRVKSIEGAQKGYVELNGGVAAFFVPGRAGFNFGKDENTLVSCYVGFSYDGPRAWDVRHAGT